MKRRGKRKREREREREKRKTEGLRRARARRWPLESTEREVVERVDNGG